MTKICLICNPTAKSGAAAKSIDDAIARLNERKADYTVKTTMYPLHATELAKEAITEGYDVIAAVGGDGTVREVALALVNTDSVLGILPCGTGNDFSRPLGISTELSKAVDVLLDGEDHPVDAGMANDQIFFNVAGFGFDVDVLDYTELYKPKHKNGSIAYLRGVLKAMFDLKLRKTTLEFPDGTLEKNCLLTAAGNGTHFGGGMMVTPLADFQDGLLDICIIHDVNRISLLTVLPRFMKGKHLSCHKMVTYRKEPWVKITCDPVSRIEVDGERMDGTPVTFKILPGALKVRLPIK